MKRLTSIFIVIVMFCTMIVPATATVADNIIQPRWSYLELVTADLSINWLGVASCSGEAITRSTSTIEVVVKLQQQKETGWSTINSWSSTNIANTLVTGKYAVERGYTYRVTVIAYVYDDNGNIVESGSTSKTCVF